MFSQWNETLYLGFNPDEARFQKVTVRETAVSNVGGEIYKFWLRFDLDLFNLPILLHFNVLWLSFLSRSFFTSNTLLTASKHPVLIVCFKMLLELSTCSIHFISNSPYLLKICRRSDEWPTRALISIQRLNTKCFSSDKLPLVFTVCPLVQTMFTATGRYQNSRAKYQALLFSPVPVPDYCPISWLLEAEFLKDILRVIWITTC